MLFVSLLSLGMAQTTEELTALKAASPLFQSKYYKANVWDVSRSPAYATADQEWRLYGFDSPYDANGFSRIDWGAADDRFLQFDLVLSDSGDYSDDLWGSENRYHVVLKLYEADGAYVKDLCNYGKFMGFGDKGFLFNQNDHFGTFFANEAYEKDASLTYTPTTGVLTQLSELSAYRYSPQLLKPQGQCPDLVYNGTVQSIPLATNEAYTITGTLLADRVGSYSVTVSLNDKENTSWSDGTTDDVYVVWSIVKADYDMSAVAWDYTEPFIWDGTTKTVTLTGLPEGVSVGSYVGNSRIRTGWDIAGANLVYDAVNYNPPSVPNLIWYINALAVPKPEVTETSFVYNGEVQGIDIAPGEHYQILGTTSAESPGTYLVSVMLNDYINTTWSDGNTDIIHIYWKIEVPTNTLEYDFSAEHKAAAFPNPLMSGTDLQVEMGGVRGGNEKVEVLNTTGAPVNVSVEAQARGYLISGLTTPGIYFVRVFTPENTIAILKVLVQ